MKKYATILILLFPLVSIAVIPDGYYDSAQGLSGTALQWALHNIIDNHTVKSYDYLWTAFFTTDDKYGNEEIVWDMYSNELYFLGDDEGGSASGEGEGYNREHSWPKSWFGDASPMNTDLFHIVPTDIYVNNRRSNYPYAEVGSTTWVSQNGSRLGYSITPGYSGMAFEPIDMYKGDFARNYFYMATRYKGEDAGWPGSAMADGADLEDWAVDMLMDWHQSDPVSTKELDRNDAVYAIQNNRNPFIDHPEYVQYVYDPVSGFSEESEFTPILLQSSPNPFTSLASLTYSAPAGAAISLRIYDMYGRLLRTIADGVPASGDDHQTAWNGVDVNGRQVAPGIYFAVLASESGNSIIKIVRADQ